MHFKNGAIGTKKGIKNVKSVCWFGARGEGEGQGGSGTLTPGVEREPPWEITGTEFRRLLWPFCLSPYGVLL